jgi:8-amino-7-oxononanoate synthase
MAHNRGRLDDALARCLDDRLSRKRLRKLTINPEGAVDFSSNTYLGLSSQPAVRRAFFARLQSAPPGLLLGSGGSRLLDGNSTFATDVEKAVTAFHRSPSGLLFTSAMDANVGLFGCVPQPGDTILYDELIHASIHDGMRLGRASTLPFAHSRVWENSPEPAAAGKLKPLETVIKSLLQGPDGSLFASGERNVFIAVEGVYSMDGDVPPLLDIVECVERCLPQGNGYVIVDEAHSNGVFDNRGRGLVCELGLEERVWARVMGFGKAMGCSGGKRPQLLSAGWNIPNTTQRNCLVLAHHPRLPDQLRPHFHLHHCLVVPVSCQH